MDKDSNNAKFNYIYIGLFAGVAVSVVGSLYYLYSLFTEDDEDLENIDLKNLNQSENEDLDFSNKEMTEEKAYFLIAMSQKKTEEKYKEKYSDLDERRREAIDNEQQYMMICNETLEAKQNISMDVMQSLYKKYNLTESDFQNAFQLIHQQGVKSIDVEKKIIKYFNINIEKKPEKETMKKIVKYYSDELTKRMRQQIAMNQNSNLNQQYNEFAQQKMMFDMIITRMKVEDLLYINFQISEFEMKNLIFEYSLHEEKGTKEYIDKIYKIEEFMG